jgi:hypothetical protein
MIWVAYKQTEDGSKRCKLSEAARPGPPRSKFQGPAQPARLWGDGTYVLIWKTEDTRPRELLRDGPREWTESDPPHPGPPEPEREPEAVAEAPPPAPRAATPPPAAPPTPAPRAAPAPAATPPPAPRAAPALGNGMGLPAVAQLSQESILANLTVALQVFSQLHQMANLDASKTIAQIQAQAAVAIEAERARCSASLGQTQEHWAALRALEREHREAIERTHAEAQTRQIEVVEAQADEQADLADQVEELRVLLQRRASSHEPSAWERLQPMIEQLAPVVLPRLAAWLDGNGGASRGSLPSDGGE